MATTLRLCSNGCEREIEIDETLTGQENYCGLCEAPYPPVPSYTPDDWSKYQASEHRAATLDDAFHKASCLAGGWYYRPVAIDYQVTADNTEVYMLRPHEIAPLDGWTPCYEVKRLG